MTGHNEISGGEFHGPVVQAGTVNNLVVVSGWAPSHPAELVSAWTGPNVRQR